MNMKSCLWVVVFIFHHSRAQNSETTLSITSVSNVTQAVEGSNVTITCLAVNLQNNPVSWFHDGRHVAIVPPGDNDIVYLNPSQDMDKYSLTSGPGDGGNFSFTIRDLSLDDIGDVSCSVTDAEPAFHTIEVIKFPDDVIVDVNSQRVEFERDQNFATVAATLDQWLNLSCSAVRSRPAAIVKWEAHESLVWDDWNVSAETIVTQDVDLFNTSTILRFPPSFFYPRESVVEVPPPPANPSANLSLQENQADEFQGVHLLAKEMASFNLTCNVTVSGWQSLKLVEVQIGDDQAVAASFIPPPPTVFIACLLCIASLINLHSP